MDQKLTRYEAVQRYRKTVQQESCTVILQNAVFGKSELISSETTSLLQERSIIPFYSE